MIRDALAASPRGEPRFVRWICVGVTVAFLALFLVVPLAAVFTEALRKGIGAYFAAISSPDALAAIRLTLLTAAIVVPIDVVFGLAAAWLVTRFRFPFRNLLITLIDLPFAVSPVVAGLMIVLLFGLQGWFGPWLRDHDLRVVFAVPGIVIASAFVTLPFVARELIPLMQEQGADEELAALTLGATPLQTFRRVTLPKVRLALFYGVVLANSRAMGEFGAVSVVSGHIRGKTDTLPLHVEILYDEYDFSGAFAVASLLSLLALVTLVIKARLESRGGASGALARPEIVR